MRKLLVRVLWRHLQLPLHPLLPPLPSRFPFPTSPSSSSTSSSSHAPFPLSSLPSLTSSPLPSLLLFLLDNRQSNPGRASDAAQFGSFPQDDSCRPSRCNSDSPDAGALPPHYVRLAPCQKREGEKREEEREEREKGEEEEEKVEEEEEGRVILGSQTMGAKERA
ncbi:unnamed protein product [Closterium sp. NIES-54]